MDQISLLLQGLAAIPVAVGSVYAVLRIATVVAFRMRRREAPDGLPWPATTLLKPVCGLEKGLEQNLRSVCEQDYPTFQVVLSVQRGDDPALPLLRQLEKDYPDRVTVAVAVGKPSANGKIFNLENGYRAARHDVIVISDSDVRVGPDYLKQIVAPLFDAEVGYACTIYRAVGADTWYEKLELLSLHDFTSDVVFAYMTGASHWCLGSSLAMRRATLEEIGGFEPLSNFLVEDWEMGRLIWERGFKLRLVPHTVETVVDLESPRSWWDHQLYWDINTRMARPGGFFAHIVTRLVPFALIFAALRLFDPVGLAVLGLVVGFRIATAAASLALLGEREGLRALPWLPVRDLAALGTWIFALRQRTVVWRGVEYHLTRDGRMVPLGEAVSSVSAPSPKLPHSYSEGGRSRDRVGRS